MHGRKNDSGAPPCREAMGDHSGGRRQQRCHGADLRPIEVIRHLQNRGCCAVLKSGIMSAKYDLIFFSDELCPLWRKLRHVALNQTGLYSATDKAQTDPILTDDATKGSSQGAFLG